MVSCLAFYFMFRLGGESSSSFLFTKIPGAEFDLSIPGGLSQTIDLSKSFSLKGLANLLACQTELGDIFGKLVSLNWSQVCFQSIRVYELYGYFFLVIRT